MNLLQDKRRKKMINKEVNFFYNWLKNNDVFTDAELQLVTDINGYNIDTLDMAVYSRCGYQTV